MKNSEGVLVSSNDRFLTWSELVERSKSHRPVMVSCLRGGDSWSYGCIPRAEGNAIFLGSLFLSRKLCGIKDPVSMLQVGSIRVSVIEGAFISRVVVRSCGMLGIGAGLGSSFTRELGRIGYVCLYIDEPVDPSGSRCLFNCGSIWGGAMVEWVISHTQVCTSANGHLVHTQAKNFLPHVGKIVLLNDLPKNPHKIRLSRAAGIWQEWDHKNQDADNSQKHIAGAGG